MCNYGWEAEVRIGYRMRDADATSMSAREVRC